MLFPGETELAGAYLAEGGRLTGRIYLGSF